MRLIDADKIVFDYSGLAHIYPNDFIAIAEYFAAQIKAMPTITPPPNAPLTLEELREMDGEPVWVVGFLKESFWGLVHVWGDSDKLECIRADHITKDGRWYGRTDIIPGWLAYRRKPEEASRMKHVCAATGGPCCWCNPGPCNSRKPEEV